MNAHRPHLVRPRWVWTGTAIAVIGTIVVGIGVAKLSWSWSIVGIVALVLGGATALAHGLMYDVHAGSPGQELAQVLNGDVHEGVTPGQTRSTPASRRTSREADQRRKCLERAAVQARRPSPVGPAAAALVLVALFLTVCQWKLYPTGLPGQTNANRALGCAIICALAGLRILTAQPFSTLRGSAGLAGLAGLALCLNGLVGAHATLVTAVAECTCGAVTVVAAALAFTHQPATAPPHVSTAPGRAAGTGSGPQPRPSARAAAAFAEAAPTGTTTDRATGIAAETAAGVTAVTGEWSASGIPTSAGSASSGGHAEPSSPRPPQHGCDSGSVAGPGLASALTQEMGEDDGRPR